MLTQRLHPLPTMCFDTLNCFKNFFVLYFKEYNKYANNKSFEFFFPIKKETMILGNSFSTLFFRLDQFETNLSSKIIVFSCIFL